MPELAPGNQPLERFPRGNTHGRPSRSECRWCERTELEGLCGVRSFIQLPFRTSARLTKRILRAAEWSDILLLPAYCAGISVLLVALALPTGRVRAISSERRGLAYRILKLVASVALCGLATASGTVRLRESGEGTQGTHALTLWTAFAIPVVSVSLHPRHSIDST
jgi:hypothetical protein